VRLKAASVPAAAISDNAPQELRLTLLRHHLLRESINCEYCAIAKTSGSSEASEAFALMVGL
jgi:hypothetical protein